MNHQEWLSCDDPEPMLKYLRRSRRYQITDRKLRLFLTGCCRRVWSHITDERSRNAVEIAERFADGRAGQKARGQARSAAHAAVGDLDRTGAALSALAAATAAWYCVEKTPWKRATGIAAAAAVGYAAYADRPLPSVAEWPKEWPKALAPEKRVQAVLLRCVVGNPFHPIDAVAPSILAWSFGLVRRLAEEAYEQRIMPSGQLDRQRLAVLADALEEAGCDNADILSHLRGPEPHVRGCFVLDILTERS